MKSVILSNAQVQFTVNKNPSLPRLHPPDRMVYFRASWATMPTSPSSREAMAEPRSRRKRDSHTRQYCSPHSPRLLHGAWKEPWGGGREEGSGDHCICIDRFFIFITFLKWITFIQLIQLNVFSKQSKVLYNGNSPRG